MTALLVAAVAGYGVHLVYTAAAMGWHGPGPGPTRPGPGPGRSRRRRSVRAWLVQAGLDDVAPGEFFAVVFVLFVVGTAGAFAMFGGPVPSLVAGGFVASFPVAAYRRRRRNRIADAQESWPHMIEEIRVLTGSAGRSIPQALFDVGGRGPDAMRPAFAAAHREWMISTDLDRTFSVLKERLADPTADAACETLLISHELGGTDLDARLSALIEDRIQDTQGRKDARAKQAGVRFARRFVLAVPIGMALAGMSVGTGRAAYQTGSGQVVVVVGIAMVIGCWLWAGRIMRLPEEQRVFQE